jgi:hypothetical protein
MSAQPVRAHAPAARHGLLPLRLPPLPAPLAVVVTERVRPSRRATDVGPADAPKERIRRLIRHVAADPVLAAWLADSKARTVHRLAADLAAAGYREAAEMARAYAEGLTHGGVSPF